VASRLARTRLGAASVNEASCVDETPLDAGEGGNNGGGGGGDGSGGGGDEGFGDSSSETTGLLALGGLTFAELLKRWQRRLAENPQLVLGLVGLNAAAVAAYLKGRGNSQQESPRPAGGPRTGVDLYARFSLAGALCCAVSHGALTPVDVVKTRMQLSPHVYNKGMPAAFRQVVAKEGPAALLTGFWPTFTGYFLQGIFKFGGYEFFKKQWVTHLGSEQARKHRTAIYLSSSAAAEVVADLALCPLESTRIRLVANPKFANGLLGCAARLLREEGVARGFYSGFVPMLFKQVPYTMAKFVVFEALSEKVYEAVPVPKAQLSNGAVTCINLGSGVGAGVVAAIISQPADTLLSQINKAGAGGAGSTASRLVNIARELGIKGLYNGTGTRCIMVGTLTACQFAIYGNIKTMLGATGGTDIAK